MGDTNRNKINKANEIKKIEYFLFSEIKDIQKIYDDAVDMLKKEENIRVVPDDLSESGRERLVNIMAVAMQRISLKDKLNEIYYTTRTN